MFCKYCGNKMNGLSCSVCGRKAVLAKRSTELEKKMAEKVPAAPKAAAGDSEYERGFLDGRKKGLQEGYRNGLSDAAKTQGTEKKKPLPLQGRMLVSAAAVAAIVGLIVGGLSFLLGYKNGQKSVWEEIAAEEEAASSDEREEPEEEVPADTEPSEKTDGPLREGMKRKYQPQMDSLHDRSGTGQAPDLRSAVNETAGEAAENPEGNDNIQKDGESKIDKRLNMCVPEK